VARRLKRELPQQIKFTQHDIEISKVCINEEPQPNAQVMPTVEYNHYPSNMYRGVNQLDCQIAPIVSFRTVKDTITRLKEFVVECMRKIFY